MGDSHYVHSSPTFYILEIMIKALISNTSALFTSDHSKTVIVQTDSEAPQVCLYKHIYIAQLLSGRSSPAKHGDAYFSAVYGFMKDLIAAPVPFEIQEV